MNLITTIKARNAAAKQSKGDMEGAIKLYEEALAGGLTDLRYILGYTVLLLRRGEYQKAREILIKFQNAPMSADQKTTLFVNYAVCVYRMGELEKGIGVLEGQHAKNPCGLVYETLGYLYVEVGDAEKALAFNLEALEYDDDDSIVLDNLAQTYYRLLGDKEQARKYFDKALAVKPAQIDTLYFLAQMDVEEGKGEAARSKLETALKGRFSPLNYATPEKIQALMETL